MYRIKRPEVAEILVLVNAALGAQIQEGNMMFQALSESGSRGTCARPRGRTEGGC